MDSNWIMEHFLSLKYNFVYINVSLFILDGYIISKLVSVQRAVARDPVRIIPHCTSVFAGESRKQFNINPV